MFFIFSHQTQNIRCLNIFIKKIDFFQYVKARVDKINDDNLSNSPYKEYHWSFITKYIRATTVSTSDRGHPRARRRFLHRHRHANRSFYSSLLSSSLLSSSVVADPSDFSVWHYNLLLISHRR